MSTSDTTVQEQVSVWISSEERQLIERAAQLAGQRVQDFVKSEVLRSARQFLRDDAVIRLTARGWEQLADLMETDAQPSEALRHASERNPDVRPVAPVRPA